MRRTPCSVSPPLSILSSFPGVPAGTSTVNYVAGDVVANTATVGLDGSGRLCVSTYAATDVVVDLLATLD